MGEVTAESLQPGTRLAQYRVVRRAGAGGMGVVYLAHDVDLDRPVALKVLGPAAAGGSGTAGGEGADRLVREARAAARLHHPNVAAVYGVGRDAGVTFLALEWVEGHTLAEHLRANVILDWAEATAALRDAAAGLAAAHAAGVLHRDVKPANLMRAAADGRVKVVDFGLARVHDVPTDLSATGVILGTPAYLSPEQCRGERGTVASDVYALGCTYYHLLTSRSPYADDSGGGVTGLLYRRLTEPLPDARLYADDLPAVALAILTRATAADPADRYPTMAAMLADLDAALAGDRAPTVAHPPEPSPAVATPHNLPQPATSFVGRTHELTTVRAMLRDHRLVTLVGPGGAGKTRLSLRVATDLFGRFPDGVRFVDLAAVPATPEATADAVPLAVASAVGAKVAAPQDVTAAVVAHLRAARALLVLDNCEHVLPAAADVAAAVLAGCPAVRVLATSRAPLGVGGEAEFRVPPLSAPPPGTAWSPADLRQLDTVRLLVDRAALVRPSFALTDDNAADVASVCRKLDGLPLAVELAAARLKSLSPRQLADRLGDVLGLLSGGPRTAQPRQRTLRAVIDWSHDLLTPPERVALARLSVFAGTASLEAAEAVLPDPTPGDPIAPADVVDLVAALVDKSLLVAEDRGGATRFRLLELVRQYAAERLDASGERPAVEARHLAHFAAMAESTYGPSSGPNGAAVMAQLDAEHDNFRAALDRGNGNEQAQRLLGNLSRYWLHRGNLAEGLARSRAVMAAAAGRPDTPHTADACNTAGVLAYSCGLLTEAFDRYTAGLTAARTFGDFAGESTALTTLSTVLKERGDLPAAREHAEAALALRRAHGTPAAIGGAMNNLANLLTRLPDEVDAARDLYRQGQALYRQVGDAFWVGNIDLNLGLLEWNVGDIPAARARYAAAATSLDAAGNRWGWAYAVAGLGGCDLLDGDLPEARRRMTDALAVFRQLGDPAAESETLVGLSGVALAEGNPVAAVDLARDGLRICRQISDPNDTAIALDALAAALAPADPAAAAAHLGAAAATRAARGIVVYGTTLAGHQATADAVRQRLGDGAFTAAFAAGQTTPPDGLPTGG